MNSNSVNNNTSCCGGGGGGGVGVIKHLNCKSTSQESTDADRKLQKNQEKIAKYSLKIEKLQQMIALDKTKEKIRIQEKEKKIQEKEENEDLKTLKKISQKYPLNFNTHIEFLETAFQNRENLYICIYKGHLLIGTYTIDDKNNITFLDNVGHHCTPSGFAVEHMRNINKILNCSPETTSTNGWDTCEIVNEEGEWVKLATIRLPKSDDDA